MKTFRVIPPLVLTLALVTALIWTESITADDHHQVASPMPVEKSMHEFTEYVFQPGYKRLKKNMASEPANKAAWKAVKGDALSLAEATNLLLDRLPEKDAQDWIKHTLPVRERGAAFYSATKKRDFTAATKTYRAMLISCNQCHKQFEDGKHTLKP